MQLLGKDASRDGCVLQRVTSIKDAAANRMKQDTANHKSVKHQPFQPNNVQQKVLDAVDVLQVGLVERDLEVSKSSTQHATDSHKIYDAVPGEAALVSGYSRRTCFVHRSTRSVSFTP